MSDRIEERLARHLRTLGETVGDEIAPPVDLELQVQRRRQKVTAARRWSVVGVAAAVIASAVTVAVMRGTTGGGSVRIETSSTTPSLVRDSLQPGTLMLAARGRFVISLNAQGHTNATMVTVAHGVITYARATDDHRAIWYLSLKNGPNACGDVVRANIDGNSSKIVTKAVAFDVSPDGTRLALYGAGNLADGQCSPVKPGAMGELAVVDVATFETSTLSVRNVTSVRWSPNGAYLAVATCPEQGCTGVGRVDVPARLGGRLALTGNDRTFSNAVRSETLAFGPDGLYVLARTTSATQTVARYDARTLAAPVPVFHGEGAWDVSQVVPTSAGTYVIATRVVPAAARTSVAATTGLYRIDAGRLVGVRANLPDPGILVPVTPLSAG